MKMITSDFLTNDLYVAVFIIAMFNESESILTLVKATSCNFDTSFKLILNDLDDIKLIESEDEMKLTAINLSEEIIKLADSTI